MDRDYSLLKNKFKLKYSLDKVLALILLIATAPIFLILAIIIKIDGLIRPENSGDVFYTNKRVSAGKIFKIIKIRTVTQKTVEWVHEEPESRSITGHPDTTHAGRFILRWYLDELPQLVNILKGDMSFVGPRPHVISQTKDEIEKYGLYHREHIKAGLLGILQAMKRDERYQRIFKKMAITKKSSSSAFRNMDMMYANQCLKKSPIEIVVYDSYLIYKGLVTVFKGMKQD